jgi:tetratricopeptide (TPR) repeat protein
MKCDDLLLLEFLRCELSEERETAVWRHLETCRECSGRIKIIAALEALYKDKPSRRKTGRYWLLAAAVLLSLTAPLLMLTHTGRRLAGIPADPAAMATSEAHPYFPLRTRSSADQAREKDEAFQAYLSGDLERAAHLLALLEPSPEIRFYLGVTQYLLGKSDPAISNLTEAACQPASEWRDPGIWYLANAHLKKGEIEQAERFLSDITGSKSAYRDRAVILLKRLRR